MHLGLIRLAPLNAAIIDARRHPMACGFSNFKQNYASVRFSYSLESIGHFYRDYVRFMDHIDLVQPGTVHRVLNERLIDDPEGESAACLISSACRSIRLASNFIATSGRSGRPAPSKFADRSTVTGSTIGGTMSNGWGR